MKTRGPLVLQVDRLEERTCPSLFGPEPATSVGDVAADGSIDENAPADVVPWGMETSGDPYDWIMMVMNPDQMMALANEYDQSPGSASMLSPLTTVAESDEAMSIPGAMPGNQSKPMGESEAMPPAQMVMEQPPLVRRSLSPSKTANMTEMTDPATGEEDSESDPDDAAMQPGANGEAPKQNQPPLLSPGDLEVPVGPSLRSGPIEPELEKAQPSD